MYLECGGDADFLLSWLNITPEQLAKTALLLSLGSVVIGGISKSMQMLTMTITASRSETFYEDERAHLGIRGSLAAALQRIEQDAQNSRAGALLAQLQGVLGSTPHHHDDNPANAERGALSPHGRGSSLAEPLVTGSFSGAE